VLGLFLGMDLFHGPVTIALLSKNLELAHPLEGVGKFKQFEKEVMPFEFTNHPIRNCKVLEFC
jgi:hypothetical protein